MKLSEKLGKLKDPATALSFQRGIKRMLRPLSVSRFMALIDQPKLKKLQQKYGDPGSRDFRKYVEAERFLKMNIRRVQDIGFDRMPPQRIFDLGSGAGYFLFVSRVLGHSGLGLDIDDCPLYPEMLELFGVQRIVHRIEKFSPLPETDGRFDWITAFSVSFADHIEEKSWDAPEWDYFLTDAMKKLRPGGRIYLDLNPRRDGSFYSEEARQLFVNRGAVVDRRSKLLFPPK